MPHDPRLPDFTEDPSVNYYPGDEGEEPEADDVVIGERGARFLMALNQRMLDRFVDDVTEFLAMGKRIGRA